jgi:hypothetical protein
MAADRSAPVCLLLSAAHDCYSDPQLFERFAQYLAAAVRATPRIKWKIKLHPAEDGSFYRQGILKTLRQLQILSPGITLNQAIAQSDVICTIRSTAGLQGMMMHRPLLVIDIVPHTQWSVGWPSEGGGLAATSSQQFIEFLNQIVDSDTFRHSILKSQDSFINKSFVNKGRAADAIVDFLEEHSVGNCCTSKERSFSIST